MSPANVSEFLTAHGLSTYFDSFTEKGWDHLPTLLNLSDGDLNTLIKESVPMLDGHALQLPIRIAHGHWQVSQRSRCSNIRSRLIKPHA